MRSHDVARSWAQSSRTHVVSVDCVEFHKDGMMPSTIQYGVRDGRLVTLSDVQRGETALMCYTCGDRIVVKDGGGSSWMGRDAATVARPSTSRTRQTAAATAKDRPTTN